jgi:hypothetical protein
MTDNIHPLPARKTALPTPSTAAFDLWNPPERLSDAMLAWAKSVAAEPLPSLPACDDRHFAKCLRIMLAVLPKQNTDELGGELFVEAYSRQLGHYPADAISHLADRATATCRWFPTISECLEILSGWRRSDDATRRRAQAQQLVGRERNSRWLADRPPPPILQCLRQDDVDAMSEAMVKIGLGCGAIIRDEQGNLKPAPADPA